MQGLLWEVLHAIGEAILVFRVFPYLDSTYALLIMPLVAFVPIALQIRAKYLSVSENKAKSFQKSMQYKRTRNLVLAVLALVSTGYSPNQRCVYAKFNFDANSRSFLHHVFAIESFNST